MSLAASLVTALYTKTYEYNSASAKPQTQLSTH